MARSATKLLLRGELKPKVYIFFRSKHASIERRAGQTVTTQKYHIWGSGAEPPAAERFL